MMDKFFVTLSSDSLCDFNEHNTISKFRVHLGRVIELIGNYEVALCEIFYPATLFNVRSSDCFLTKNIVATLKTAAAQDMECSSSQVDPEYKCLSEVKEEHEIVVEHFHVSKYALNSKYYHSTDDFLYEFNEQMLNLFSCSIDEESKKVILTCQGIALDEKEKITYTLSDTLGNILGFPKNTVFTPGFAYRSESLCDLRKGVTPMLYVCSNIITDQIVNNGHDKVLRTFHISPEKYTHGFQKKESFQRLHFLAVAQNKIEFMDIYIRDETGNECSFTHGTLKVVLLFRRVAGNE
jgi:hypothetical protein